MTRIYLSPPDVGSLERELLLDAFDSNWVAPLGPHVDAFEREVAGAAGVAHAAALSSGTAALHLALLILGVRRDDDVIVPTMTFAATANAVTYVGARPVLVDSESVSWNVDPALVVEALRDRTRRGRRPAAVITVDLYGQCADHDPIRETCDELGIPLIEDAAEAIGADYKGRPAGSLGDAGALSFNGNKLLTTGGGGALVAERAEWIERARHLASQAREPAPHYEHVDIGFNYRLSNLLAAVGRGQLRRLRELIAARRTINERYREALDGVAGISFLREAPWGTSTHWLTCVLIDPNEFGAGREEVRAKLEKGDIESRPTWKPMHLQKAFSDCDVIGGAVAERIFDLGLCLPSGSSLSRESQERVIDELLRCRRG